MISNDPRINTRGLRLAALRQSGPPDRPWCVEYQTDTMPAPAFWYYATQAAAIIDREGLIAQYKVRDRS
jgi:hypothetical protein